jgi:hypothetical protein
MPTAAPTPKVFRIKTFVPKRMLGDDATCLLIGKRKCGKTTALLDLLYSKRRTPDGVVFCGTAESNAAYDDIIPDSYVYGRWDPVDVQRFMDRQKAVNGKRKRNRQPKKYSFMVIDDLAWDKKFTKDPMYKEILMNGRWDGIAPMFVTAQYCLAMEPAFRNQFDYIFLFRDIIPDNRRRLYQYFCGQLGTFKEFERIFDFCTDNYGALVVKNNGNSTKIEENFFHFRAKIRNWHDNPGQKPWHVGSRQYWEAHFANSNYDETYSCSGG